MIVRCVFAAAAAVAFVAAPLPAKTKDPVKVTGASAAKGVQRLVIGQFTLGFLVERKDSSKAGGGLMGSGSGGRSTTRSTLTGYTPADLQAIADAGHADLEARLKAAGYEVVDRAAFAQHPAYTKTKPLAHPYEQSVTTGRDDKAKVLFVSASQTAPLRLHAGDVMAGGLSAMGLMMSGSQVTMGASDFAKTAGVHVVNAVYYVDFADSDEYGGWFRSSSAVKVSASLAMLPDQTKLSVLGPNDKSATLALANPVAVGGDFFEVGNANTGGDRAGQAIANVIGVLGGLGTNSSRKLSFVARPGTFVPGATQATAEANQVLVERLAALR